MPNDVYTSGGQKINAADPNYSVYAAQNNPNPNASKTIDNLGLNSGTKPVSGTDSIRNQGTNLLSTINTNLQPMQQMSPMQQNSGQQNNSSLPIPTPPSSQFNDPAYIKSYIDSQVGDQKSQYDSLINKAQQDKQQGMPKDIVNAGEAGGFMSTQFSGQAALQSTNGGNFVGAGGALEKQQSAYDYNIQQAKTQQIAAMSKAQSDAQTYIQTGKQQDYNNAITAYNAAKAAEAQAQNMAIQQGTYQMQTQQFPLQMSQLAAQAGYSQQQYVNSAIAPSMAAEISSGGDVNSIMDKYSKQYGISPTALASGYVSYSQEQQKQQWLNSSQAAGVLSKTSSGGSIDTPYGKMDVMGQTLKGNDGTFWRRNDATGQYENVGIPASTNINQLLSLVQKAQAGTDPALAKSLEDFTNAQLTASGQKNINFTAPAGDGSAASQLGSVSYRTNNPGNIKFGDYAASMGATDSGITASDGGTFAKFNDVSGGMKAQQGLLQGSGYANLTLDAAMKRWSNKGYGAEVAPSIPANTLMKDLSPTQLNTLTDAQKNREGWKEPSQSEIAGANASDWIKAGDASAPDPQYANVAPVGVGRTPNSIYQNAIAYAEQGGSLQKFVGGLSSSGASAKIKDAVDNKASALAAAAGVRMVDLRKEYISASAGLTKLYDQFGIRKAGELGAIANADLVTKYSGEAGRSQSPLVNKYTLWARKNIKGDVAPSNLETAIYAFSREYARVSTGNASASGLTDSATAATTRLMNATKNPEQLTQEMNIMKTEMANVMKGQTDMIDSDAKNENLPNLQAFTKFLASNGSQLSTDNTNTTTPQKQTYSKQELSSQMDQQLQSMGGKMNDAQYQYGLQQWLSNGGDAGDYQALYASKKQ